MRRAKIVSTLGPATDSYEQIKALVEAGMDVARLNISHGTHAEHEERYQPRAQGRRRDRAAASASSPTFKVRRSGSAASAKARYSSNAATSSPSPSRTIEGDRHRCGTTYAGLAADVAPGERILVDDGRVTLEVTAVDGPASAPRHRGRHGLRPQGPQPARRRRLRARPVREGRRRPALGAAHRRRRHRPLLRAQRPTTSRTCTAIMAEEGRRLPVIAKIEKPQAVDEPRGHRRRLRRHHGRPRRPRRRDAAGAVPLVQKRAIKLASATPSRSSSPPRCSTP